MKKLLTLFTLLCASVVAHACPFEFRIVQRDATDTTSWTRQICPPSPTTISSVLMYDLNTGLPVLGQLSGLSWDGTTLSVTGGSGVTSVGLTSTNLTVTGSPITGSGTLTVALPNVGTAGAYSGTVTIDAQGRVTAGTNRSFSSPSRALNTCFQISATRDALVSYAVDVTTTVTLGGTPEGAVFLRTYTNSSCSTGQVGVISGSNGQPTTLSVAVGQQVKGSVNLYGVVQAGTWARMETSNVSGSPGFSIRAEQQEVQL